MNDDHEDIPNGEDVLIELASIRHACMDGGSTGAFAFDDSQLIGLPMCDYCRSFAAQSNEPICRICVDSQHRKQPNTAHPVTAPSRLSDQPIVVTDFDMDKDVLLGRGGYNGQNPGNQRFLDQRDVLRPAYKATSDPTERVQIVQELVDWVHAKGGRFLQRLDLGGVGGDINTTNQWCIVDHATALRKARQSLSEAAIRTSSTIHSP